MEHGYAVGGYEEAREIPLRSELEKGYAPPSLLHAMDISSVRYPPTSAMTSADQASAHGLPRSQMEVVKSGRFNSLLFGAYFLAYFEMQSHRSFIGLSSYTIYTMGQFKIG